MFDRDAPGIDVEPGEQGVDRERAGHLKRVAVQRDDQSHFSVLRAPMAVKRKPL